MLVSFCVPRFDLGSQPGIQFGNHVVRGGLAAIAELDRLRKGRVFLAQLVQTGAGLADGFANLGLRNQGLVDAGMNRVHLSASVVITGLTLGTWGG